MELKLIETAQPHVSYYRRQAKLTAKQVSEDLYKIIAGSNYDMASVIRYLDKLQEASK